jgi:predicted ATPase/class 3 adenylate cyclase
VSELPTGTVTFLFTDLEGSTRLWEEQPEAMRTALARHDELLIAAIAAHGGHVIKGMGDGVHAVFATADAAVAAAVEAQQAVEGEPWGPIGSLRVRMGLHTGVAEQRGDDYFGPTLNRAARLMAVAHGGQVVCSHATADLARDVLAEVEFLDLGEHRLRDLSRAERVFQVCAAGLRSAFAPLQSVDAFPGNLPVQTSSFVGRSAEVRATIKALGESRMVTLTGVGGVGKTRLAVQVAGEVLPEYPDGAWLCELASAGDGEAMVQLIAATLGVQPHQGLSLAGSIRQFLEAKCLLLVLDNCEHLLDAAGRIADDILHFCPRVRILATSREGLGVEGEHNRVVRSLALPEVSSGPGDAMASDAVRLFADRAHAFSAEFSLDASQAATVADVCRRLDGVPLAIELAAARVAVMSPREIRTRLDERFRLLTGGRRTAVERHQTLRATVEWSYSLLTETEQRVFDRLGSFTGTFSGEAAEAVLSGAGLDAWEVLEAISSLVSKSMVVVDHVSAEGITRYAMLETLRAYARERLDESGEADLWRRRHARYYASFAEEAGAGLTGADELIWRPRVRAELDNLRAAVNWALDATEPADLDCGLRIIGWLANVTNTEMTSGVGVWAIKAIPQVGQTTPGIRTAILGAAAFQATFRGDFDRAIELAQQALADGIPANCPAPGLVYTAWGISLLKNMPVAFAVMADGVDKLAAAAVDDYSMAMVLTVASTSAALSENLKAAQTRADEAVRAARRSRSPSALAYALYALGQVLVTTDPGAALVAFEEGLAPIRSGASTNILSPMLCNIGAIRAAADDAVGAIAALREAVIHACDAGYRPIVISALDRCMHAFASLKLDEPAAVLAGVAAEGPLADMSYLRTSTATERHIALDSVRDRLGVDHYDRTVQYGSGLSYEEVVRYARQLFDDLEAESADATASTPDASGIV